MIRVQRLLAAACFAAVPLAACCAGPLSPAGAGIVIGAFALALLRPADGFLLFFALSPISSVVPGLTGSYMYAARFAETLFLAVLAGCLAGDAVRATRHERMHRSQLAALVLAVLAICSVVPSVVQEYLRLGQGMGWHRWFWQMLTREYLAGTAAPVAIYDATLLFECGIGFIVAGRLFSASQQREAAVRMLIVGAAAAAALNGHRLAAIMLRASSAKEAIAYALALRIDIHSVDLNAAGSYFAMMLCAALPLAWRMPRLGVPCIVAIATGELLAGSRAAFASLAVAAVGTMIYADFRVWKTRGRAVTLATLLLIGTVAWPAARALGNRATHMPVSAAFRYRVELAQAALAMARQHPLIGVGIGEFAGRSPYLRPDDAYGQLQAPENAHNQFLQILAELGVSGFAAFLGVLVFSLWRKRRPTDGATVGLLVGIIAFLISCLAGHPLLITTVAFAFWMSLAIYDAEGQSAAASRRFRAAALIAVVVALLTVPARAVVAFRDADLEHVAIGVSGWMTDEAGDRYRLANSCATFYMPTIGRRVDIPLRPDKDMPGEIEVELALGARVLDRVTLTNQEWRNATFTGALRDLSSRRYVPVTIRVFRDGAQLPCETAVVRVRRVASSEPARLR